MKALYNVILVFAMVIICEAEEYTRHDALTIINWELSQKKLKPIGDDDKLMDVPLFNTDRIQKIVKEKSKNSNKSPLAGLKIRQDYQDVVSGESKITSNSEEATSQNPDVKSKKSMDQLSGATFGLTDDKKTGHTSVNVKAAVLYPYHWDAKKINEDFPWLSALDSLDFLPSVSLNKYAGKDPKKQVDSLVFRAGFSSDFEWVIRHGIGDDSVVYRPGLNLRLYPSYATDTGFRTSIVAGQFDVEPTYESDHFSWLQLGYHNGIKGISGVVHAGDDDYKNHDDFGYTLRFYMHGEFGDVKHAPGDKSNLDVPLGAFFRLGPVVRLEINPYGLSRFINLDGDAITAHVNYSYLPDIGDYPLGRDSLLSAGIDYALFPKEDPYKFSLKLLYERGGLDLSKQSINQWTFGIGTTF